MPANSALRTTWTKFTFSVYVYDNYFTGIYKVPGGATSSPAQTGFLLMYTDGKTGRESDVVTVTP